MASFITSSTPDITESTVTPFSQRVKNVVAATRSNYLDIVVGGIGFCIDPDGPRDGSNGPYLRQTVPVRKDQIDTSEQAGEQSLDGYWIRSQNSWHRGAGINYYEPGSEKDTAYRFSQSSGMDVWTKGEARAHHAMSEALSTSSDCWVMDAGNGIGAYLSDTAVVGWTDGTGYSLNAPAAGHQGRYFFFGDHNYVKVGWVSPKSATVGVWAGGPNKVVASNATLEPVVWYAKDRYIVAHGSDLFEVPPLTTTAIDLSDSTAALYSPQVSTTWVDVVDGPSAIYAAHQTGIVSFTLQDASSGQTPKLSQAYRVLDLPAGERAKSMFGYLGRYLILSTTSGIRVCVIDGNGGIVMGPVLVPATLGDFRGMSAYGDIVYVAGAYVPAHNTTGGDNLVGWGERAGMVAINLGEPVGDGSTLQYAWAMDERSDVTGVATSCLVLGGVKHLAVNGSGFWATDPTGYVSGGYLALGRIRFNSTVPKIYRALDMLGALGTGSMEVQILDERDVTAFRISMDPTTGVFQTVGLDLTRLHTFIRPVGVFTWTDGEPPVLNLVQLRALPAPQRVRKIRYPLRCLDREQDRNGQAFGHKGFAYERLTLLEQIEESGLPVTIIDNRVGEQFLATIDDIQFSGEVAPDRGDANYGGTLQLTLTKLT